MRIRLVSILATIISITLTAHYAIASTEEQIPDLEPEIKLVASNEVFDLNAVKKEAQETAAVAQKAAEQYKELDTTVLSQELKVNTDGLLTDEEVENLKAKSKLTDEQLEEAQKLVDTFQKPLDISNDKEINEMVQKNNDFVKGMFEPKIQDANKNSCESTAQFKNTYLYFYSFSMPANSIKDALKDAIALNKKGDCSKIVLVVKGMKDGNMRASLVFMYEAMKELNINQDLPVEMNPELFEKYSVQTVPSLIYEDNDSVTTITGDVNLSYLIDKAKEKHGMREKVGNTYPVAEKDFRQDIKDKLSEALAKMKARIPEIRKTMFKVTKYDGVYPTVKEDNAFYVDMSITLDHDIVGAGKVIAKAGAIVNPAVLLQLPGKLIFIDGNDPKQLQYVKDNNFNKIIVVSGDLEAIMKSIKKRVYAANDLILSRFGIKALPSIVQQEGEYVRIFEKNLN